MRKLKTSDFFSCGRCIKVLGLEEKIREVARSTQKDIKTDTDAGHETLRFNKGFDFIWSLFDAATEPAGEAAIYEFLAGPFEKTPEQMADLDFDELTNGIEHIIKNNDLAGFFKRVQDLIQ